LTAQYNRVKTGDVYIEKSIATTSSVRLEYLEETKEQYELWRNVDAQRSFNIARLEGRNTEREFLYVTYDGPDALKVSSTHVLFLISLTSCSDRHSNKILTSSLT
jgi:hypothetical protein